MPHWKLKVTHYIKTILESEFEPSSVIDTFKLYLILLRGSSQDKAVSSI